MDLHTWLVHPRASVGLSLRFAVRALLGAAALALSSAASGAGCPPADWPVARLDSLKAIQWALELTDLREHLALDLLPCLAAPDPHVRDELAFEALQTWLRRGELSVATSHALGVRLQDGLSAADAGGFGPPFAALALSEVVRDDRLRGVWTPAERDAALTRVAEYLRSITDYRGFEPGAGWRHGVAHAADALMQFALNPLLTRDQLDRILAAAAGQVMPASGHAYVHGESERLARPVLFVARRGLYSADEWRAWFARLAAAAAPKGEKTSTASLARAHNLKAFTLWLYAAVHEGGHAELREQLLPALSATLHALP